MSEHPLTLSTRLIDSGVVGDAASAELKPNRITQELSELADGIALVESFSHVVAIDTGDGLVAFDSSGPRTGGAVLEALRGWSDKPVRSIVYTHGHVDHVGGSGAFAAEAADRGRPAPEVLAQQAVDTRFDRYRATNGYNKVINSRQFGGAPKAAGQAVEKPFLPDDTLRPDTTYETRLEYRVGDVDFVLNACKGETDDHTWTWVPQHRMISAGDQFTWTFPNCGNPQKVQRYPFEWAESLRAMAAMEPELFVPAHGLPITGAERIRSCLITVATTLEQLVADVVEAMNAGAVLDDIVHSVTVLEDSLALPFLRPVYDEPEFVVRNIWRLYGGWWDGNPARLKPPSDEAVGVEVAALAGGVDPLIARAQACSTAGDHRMACQLIEFAVAAEPESAEVHKARAEIYGARRPAETSLMAKGIFLSARADSELALTGEVPEVKTVLPIDA
ncbi:MAG: alkyl sulfatase dimerization domain-containing protein [Acidimicrobiales bacterium]